MSTLFLGAALHRDKGSQPSVAAATPLMRGSNVLQSEHAASAAEAMLRAAAALAAGLDRRDSQSDKSRDNATVLSHADAVSHLAGAGTPAGDAVDTADDGRDPGYDVAEDEADDYGTQLSGGAPTPASHSRAAWVKLRTAALAASTREPSFTGESRPRKIAFLFLTRGPLPHARLWERFFQGHAGEFVVHVHASPGFELNASTVASHVFYGRTIASPVVVEWGQMSVVAAERRLFATALLDSDVTRMVLLSESCVPLRSFSYVQDYLLNNDRSFLDSFIDVQSRYNPRMAPTIPEVQWRKGTQWAAVTRAHAELFVSDELVFSLMRRYCRTWTDPEGRYGSFCAGDEHYKQVIVQRAGLEGEIERRPVTFANWFPTTRAHPKLYVVQEVTAELVQDLQVHVCSFLRAFRVHPPLGLTRPAQCRTELWRPMEGEHMRCGLMTDAKTCVTRTRGFRRC